MGWIGGLIGGGIGAMFGGPFGALLGAALGTSMSSGTSGAKNRPPLGQQEQKQAIFFTAGFSMAGKMAKADGQVTEDEVAAIRKVMDHLRLDPQSRQLAFDLLKQSKSTPDRFEDYAAEFGRTFAHRPDEDLCLVMMEFLFEVALADGELHATEERLLNVAQGYFQLSDTTYGRLRTRYLGAGVTATAELDAHYATLGVSPTATPDAVKKAWRSKVAEFHPDKIQSKGLPPEFLDFANDKLAEINRAYEAINRVRTH